MILLVEEIQTLNKGQVYFYFVFWCLLLQSCKVCSMKLKMVTSGKSNFEPKGKNPRNLSYLFAINILIWKLSYYHRAVLHLVQYPVYRRRPPWAFPTETASFLALGHVYWEPLSNLDFASQYKLSLLHRKLPCWKAILFIDKVPFMCMKTCYHELYKYSPGKKNVR